MKADVKAIVNDIVDELAKEERVAECYQAWLKSREEIQHYYKDSEIERIPLSQQKELKSIKNMVIREAVRFGEGYLYLEEAETGIERLEEISEQQTESLAALQGEDMPDIMPEQTEMEEQESDRQEEGQGESISYFARWTDRYKEAREYLYGTMEQNRMRRQPMRLCWKRQSREMRMPCTTWERFMHRALDVRQTKKRQMCGTKKHWRQCIM